VTRDDAERLNIAFLQIVGRLNETAAYVRDKDNEENWHQYRRAVGKAMDVSGFTQARLNAVARRLNERPRKTLDYETPAERFYQFVASTG